MSDVFSYCAGVVPLRPRVAPWMLELMASGQIAALVAEHGSPLNIQSTAPFLENLAALNAVAKERALLCRPYFARKANKCLAYVAAANDAGYGIDAASSAEVQQSLALGVAPARITCTAGVKSEALVALCVEHGVTIIIDNDDELALISQVATSMDCQAPVGLRVAGFRHRGDMLHSRFGFPVARLSSLLTHIQAQHPGLKLAGLQFHLSGYDAAHRASAISELLPYLSELQSRFKERVFLDIGGGIPMRYLQEPTQWQAYLDAHADALDARSSPITYCNDALGRKTTVDGWSKPDAYPTALKTVQNAWLAEVLDTHHDGQPLHRILATMGIELRLEPGRSALDGCGMSVARVVHRKRDTDDNLVIGLEMNRTQFRTGFAEVMFDPLMLPVDGRDRSGAVDGYLTGTYCTESEFIYRRRFRFPSGVVRGDLMVFPNTAGYLMHFLESRSHQFELAGNVFIEPDGRFRHDGIDQEEITGFAVI